MNELQEILSSLGLEHQESNVYLMSLSLGSSPASNIAKRCNLPRSTARYTCEQLVGKQLMIETQKGHTKYFTPENPEKLKKLLEMQYEKIQLREKKLDFMMQDLKRLYNPYTVLPKMRFYEGVEGIIEMFEDVLREDITLFGALSLTEDIHPEILKYVEGRYVPRRIELGNSAYIIFNDNAMTKAYQKKDSQMHRTSLLVPEKTFPIHSCYHIYGNKVAFYSYAKNDMTGIIVENELIHESQMSLFRLAWKHASTLKQNSHYSDLGLPI